MLELVIKVNHDHLNNTLTLEGHVKTPYNAKSCQHELYLARLVLEWMEAHNAGMQIFGVPEAVAPEIERMIREKYPNAIIETGEKIVKEITPMVKEGMERFKQVEAAVQEAVEEKEVLGIDKSKLN